MDVAFTAIQPYEQNTFDGLAKLHKLCSKLKVF